MTTDQKIPLSKRSNKAGKVKNVQFSADRIIWKSGEPTIFPNDLLTDAFACAFIKYFNSPYFMTAANDPSYIANYRNSVILYLEIMAFNKLKETPVNSIYLLIDAYLKKKVEDKEISPMTEFRLYSAIRSPALRFSTVGGTKKQKYSVLLRNIEFNEDERVALVQAAKNAPNKKRPEVGDRVNINYASDIIEQFDLSFPDASNFMMSMRAFCAFYIIEWGAIRDAIYEKFSAVIGRHIERYEPTHDAQMSKSSLFGRKTSGADLFNHQVCFDITKEIDHPFLTERFVTEYMAVCSGKNTKSEAAKTIWDWSTKTSTSNEYDWLSVIDLQFKSTSRYKKRKLCPAFSDSMKLLGTPSYANTTPEFRGLLRNVFPTKDILGISKAEEVCLTWILASDRHQPSNLQWMSLGDITVTNNSISTIVDVDSFKRRASLTSGRDYDQLVESLQGFIGDAGETYKKNQNIFKAITCYRDQVIRSHSLGMSEPDKQGRENDLWLFDGIRAESTTRHGCLISRNFRLFQGNESNFGITLCAIKGTVSNKYVLEKCPQAAFFLENLSKVVDGNPNNAFGSGVKSLAIHLISKAAVNLKVASRYSFLEITPKENSSIEVDDRESVLATERDAALDFHTPKTRTQYVDKLPDYLTESVDFGARVGDEFIRMAKELSFSQANASEVMSLADIRKRLGIQTTAEAEIEQIDELFSKLDSEGAIFDDLGIIKEDNNKNIIVRHPILIAKIKNEIESIKNQLDRLAYSNSERVNKAIIRFMYLNMVLREKFTVSEIKQSDDLYGDVEFPSNDILI
jgi:hypothetical protein